MNISYPKIKFPFLSLLCMVIFIGGLIFTSTRVYYRSLVPICNIEYNETNSTVYCSTLNKYLIENIDAISRVTLLRNTGEDVIVDKLSYDKTSKDSTNITLHITSLHSKVPHVISSITDTLVFKKTLFSYLHKNISARID